MTLKGGAMTIERGRREEGSDERGEKMGRRRKAGRENRKGT